MLQYFITMLFTSFHIIYEINNLLKLKILKLLLKIIKGKVIKYFITNLF